MNPKLSLQTYTIRKPLNKKMETAVKELTELGIHAIECARVPLTYKNAVKLKCLCEKYNLEIVSSQIKLKTVMNHYEETIKIHQLWDCNMINISMMPLKYLIKKEKGILEFCKILNTLGKRLFEDGISLLYHHHHFEFLKIKNQCILDLMIENTDPDYVSFCFDTYWIQKGGKSPVQLIERYGQRIMGLHLREFQLKRKWFSLYGTDAAIGEGNLDFKGIIDACINNKVLYMAIEQNTKKPFKDILHSITHIKNLGYGDLFFGGEHERSCIF